MKQLTRQEVEAVLAKIAFLRFEETPTQSGNFGPGLIPGKRPIYKMGPIKIGDVLEKIDKTVGGLNYYYYIGQTTYNEELIHLWSRCGELTLSLQEICEASGWEEVECIDSECPCGVFPLRNNNCPYKAIIKSPETNALFSFLLQIGL